MISYTQITEFSKQRGVTLALGIALGALGSYLVRWLQGCNPTVSLESFPRCTFDIIYPDPNIRNEWKVKTVTQSEFEKEVTDDNLNALRKSVGWSERTVEQWKSVRDLSRHIVCVMEKGTVIGSGCLQGNGVKGLITDIIVHKEYQKRGIGTLVMNNLAEYIKPKGYGSVCLFGWDGNETVFKFYEKFGFRKNPYGMETTSDSIETYIKKN